MSLNCSNVCWSVFQWSNVFLLTLHIIACALLINKDDVLKEKKGEDDVLKEKKDEEEEEKDLDLSNDETCQPVRVEDVTNPLQIDEKYLQNVNDVSVSSILKTSDFQCKTCQHHKSKEKLPPVPPLDGVANDIRNKFAAKPINITKPLNISPTLRKKRLKVEQYTQTISQCNNTATSLLQKQKIKFDQLAGKSNIENSIYASTEINRSLMTIATQTNVQILHKITQTTEIISVINTVDKGNQSEFDMNVTKPKNVNKSIHVAGLQELHPHFSHSTHPNLHEHGG